MPARIARPAAALLVALALGAGTTRAQSPGTVLDVWTDQITGNDDAARGLALYPDGSFVVTGATYAPAGTTGLDSVIVRYRPDGTRDTGFGGYGTGARRDAWSTGNDFFYPMALQADGKVVAAGVLNGVTKGTLSDSFAVRYLADGTPDTGFGTGGRSIFLASKSNDRCYDLALQADGKIVLVGTGNAAKSTGRDPAPDRTTVARLLPNGALDASFGSGGVASFALGAGASAAGAVAVQADGKIVVGGDSDQTVGGVTQRDLTVLRLNPNGTLDPTFGTGGVRGVRIPGLPTNSGVGGCLRVQPDGKIVVGGGSGTGNARTATVVRLNPNGSLDATFNGTGVQASAVPSFIYSLTLNDRGDVVTCGSGTVGGVDGIVVARFTATGALDTTNFNAAGATPGYAFANINTVGSFPWVIAYRPNDNTILVGGAGSSPSGTQRAFGYLRVQN